MKDIQKVLKMGPEHTFVYMCAVEKLPMEFAKDSLGERAEVVLLQICDFANKDEFGILQLKRQRPDVAVPYEKIVAIWHEELPRCQGVNLTSWNTESKRHQILAKRYQWVLKHEKINGDEAKALNWFRAFFRHLSKSKFLMDKESKFFIFEWPLRPDNFQKIMDGNYHKPQGE